GGRGRRKGFRKDRGKAERETLKVKIVGKGGAEVDSERNRGQEELLVKGCSVGVDGAEKIGGCMGDEAANNDIIDKLVAEL
ncbi:F0F1 ATP synthase subunit B, partial [[Pasteurella] aerogenes]